MDKQHSCALPLKLSQTLKQESDFVYRLDKTGMVSVLFKMGRSVCLFPLGTLSALAIRRDCRVAGIFL